MKINATLAVAGLCLASSWAIAGPADAIFTPHVEQGEVELEFKYGQIRPANGGAKRRDHVVGIGYGVTDWWFTEIAGKYKKVAPAGSAYDAFEWENKFQLTETGKYPVDLGLLVEIERPTDRTEGYEVKWGPLLQADFGKWQLNGNLFWERNHRNVAPGPTKLLHQEQVKYRWKPELEFGIQSFGEVGQWNAWLPRNQRQHSIGPALMGKIPLGDHHALKYDVAVLVGTTPATADRTLRLKAEYEF
jgi:hypothetical protein